MIDGNKRDGFILSCECCGKSLEFDEFYDAVYYKQDNNWKSVKIKADLWEDYCPQCSEEVNNEK